MQDRPGRFRAVGGLGSAFAILAAMVAVAQSVAVILRWIGYQTVAARIDRMMSWEDYRLARPTLFPLELGLWLSSWLTMVVAWIVLTVWMWRARKNADTYSWATHRMSSPWAFWSWVAPVVALWLPAVFVNDLDKASASRHNRVALIASWWAAWILAWMVFWIGLFTYDPPADHNTGQTMRDSEINSLFTLCTLLTASVLLFAIAAGCLTTSVLRISRMQTAWAAR